MTENDIIIAIILTALALPGLAMGWFTLRGGRFIWALACAVLFFGVAFVLFAKASSAPHDDAEAVGQVLIAFFVLVPAGLSALLGGAIGRAFARRR